jgi:hypothetical protein
MRIPILSQNVFHVPRMERLDLCVWVDTETKRYACYCCVVHAIIYGEACLQEAQAKKIVHYPNKNLILIDPVDDEPEKLEDIVTKNLEKQL